jgi:hypothetical protein
MASKKECDRCKVQAPFGTLKGWGVASVADFGAGERDTERPHHKAELCPPCKEAVIRFTTTPPPMPARG